MQSIFIHLEAAFRVTRDDQLLVAVLKQVFGAPNDVGMCKGPADN